VSKDVDCQVFRDQLDALVQGALPEEGARQLRLHVADCPECAMQLKVQEHLAGPSLAELEAQVPDDLVASIWSRIRSENGAQQVGGSAERHRADRTPRRGSGWGTAPVPTRRPFTWLVPTLAAATLILVFSTGFLVLELGRLRDREGALAQQVTEQQRWLAELEVGATADPVARTAALAGRNPWIRALSRKESISIRGLQLLLQRMPGDRTVLTRAQLDSVLRSRTRFPVPLLREALTRIDGGNGVQARDLLKALEALNVDAELTFPTAEIVELLS
jgi:hypothetical protein